MATLTHQLVISSTTTSSDALSINTSDTLTVTEPSINIARKSIATGSAQSILPAISAKFTYIYIKAISGTATTDWVQIKINSQVMAKLRLGESMWLPIYNNYAVEGEAYGNAVVVEYGQWSV
tara:strand:- start:37402 stop:37767 length:366 start_codon:yes stop_codon:yes gene_type:complete